MESWDKPSAFAFLRFSKLLKKGEQTTIYETLVFLPCRPLQGNLQDSIESQVISPLTSKGKWKDTF